MARPTTAHRRARGGEVVPPSRPHAPRLTAALCAVIAALALAAYPALSAGSLLPLAAAIGAIALLLLLGALAGLVALLPWSLGALGLEFVLVDVARSEPALAAAIVGAGLLVTAELAYASRELARGREEELGRRVAWLALVAGASLVGGLIPASASALAPRAGEGVGLVALLAAVVLLGAPAALARRRPGNR
jgi:hypothetical protein